MGFRIAMVTGPWTCQGQYFESRLTEVGGPILNVGGAIPWAGVLEYIQKEKAR